MGRFRPKYQTESSRLVRGNVVMSGWSPRSSLSERTSREERVSPLQRLSARQTGIQVVPRKGLFALSLFRTQGVFISVLKIKTQT